MPHDVEEADAGDHGRRHGPRPVGVAAAQQWRVSVLHFAYGRLHSRRQRGEAPPPTPAPAEVL